MPDSDKKIIRVALPIPFADTLSYLVPDHLCDKPIDIGMRVVVPFINKQLVAVIVSLSPGDYTKNLKHIIELLDKDIFLPLKNIEFMKILQSYDNVNQGAPYSLLLKVRVSFLVLHYFLI